ncbi:MAG: D-alanyl-D-alanine carboxypeptidase [Lachnospirales bacterium]
MKKIFIVFLLFIFIFNNSISAFADDLPSISSKSGILIDKESGRVLWGKNQYEVMPMASTTKIMTLLVALENATGDEEVVVSSRASRAPDVQLDVVEGEEFTLRDLYYPLMLESANDVSIVVAESIGGSVEGFADMMTNKAKEIGAMDTSFKNPNGLDEEGHYTTAYDLAIITKYALDNEEFCKIISTSTYTFKSDKKTYNVSNKNRLLTSYEGGNGVKTGYTNLAANCFVGSATRGDMQLISVVLQAGWGATGKEGKWTDTYEILNYGFNNYKYYDLIDAGKKEIGYIDIVNSKVLELPVYYNVTEKIRLPLRSDEVETFEVKAEYKKTLEAPVKEGDEIGFVALMLNGEALENIPIVVEGNAEIHDFIAMTEKVLESWFNIGFNNSDVDIRGKILK